MIILNGIKLGIVLAFLIGPVFFAIIQTSIERGFTKGVLVCLGVSISDIFYVVVCCLGLIGLVENESVRHQMAYVGGGILIAFGIYYLLVKTRNKGTPEVEHFEEKKGIRYLLKGIVINAFSPMVPLFWIGTLSIATIDFGYQKTSEIFIFYSTVLLTTLGTDVAKAYLAHRLRRIITPRLMVVMNATVGVALVIFGIRLLLLAGAN